MGFTHAWHQGRAAAVDYVVVLVGQGRAVLGDLLDPLAFDQNLAGKRLGAAAIENGNIGEKRAHDAYLPPVFLKAIEFSEYYRMLRDGATGNRLNRWPVASNGITY